MKGDISGAVVYLEKAVALDPSDVTSQYNLANAYLDSGTPEKAISVLQKVVQLDPSGEIGQDAREKLAELRK
jgi:FimV-like protein